MCTPTSIVNGIDVVLNNNDGDKNAVKKGILVNNQQQPSVIGIECTNTGKKKSKMSNRSVSFHHPDEGKQLTMECFGVKSYVHNFYEPTSESFLKGDDFEFYVEPTDKGRYAFHCSKCFKFSFIIITAVLYTVGILCLFTMPEDMEYDKFGIFVFSATLIISVILTFMLVWWMCSLIVQTRRHSEPIVYSAVLNAGLMREVYSNGDQNTYFRRIPPFSSEIKAIQLEH